MHLWRTRAIAVITALFLAAAGPAHAVNWACAADLDGDGLLTSAGETASCNVLAGGNLCPIGATACNTPTPVCPLDPTLPCTSGSCTQPVACTSRTIFLGLTVFTCPVTGSTTLSGAACAASCNQTAVCPATTPTCPLANGGPCLDSGGGTYQCSPNTCIDLDVTQPVTGTIDNSIFVNDGATDANGACLDQIMIFSGRKMECRTAGVDTAFQTCCKDFDMVVQDSTGTSVETAATLGTISEVYSIAAATYTAYTAEFASTYAVTGSASAAASSATTVATSQFQASVAGFDPTTIAISIAIAIAVEYFVNNCNQNDMETGIATASGWCYETGKYCKRSWTGFGCVQEAKTFCCFNSKLARIIHEQGRPQLASFNNVPADNCRGFYPEEFQYLDFSKIDLSSYYGDLKKATEAQMGTNMTDKVNEFYNSMPTP